MNLDATLKRFILLNTNYYSTMNFAFQVTFVYYHCMTYNLSAVLNFHWICSFSFMMAVNLSSLRTERFKEIILSPAQ